MQTLTTNMSDGNNKTIADSNLLQDPVEFLQSMIRCNTVNRQGDEQALAGILASALRNAANVEVTEHVIEPGRCNLIARLRSNNPGPTVVLSGHLDTVPVGNVAWTHDPFSAHIVDGKMYGRGAVDMKSGLAALLYAFLRIARQEPDSWQGELILAATSSEETGAEGAALMVESGQLPAFDTMIIAEPTDNQMVVTHKGVLWVKLVSHGKAAHGSMPSAGINAIDRMLQLRTRLSERLHWESTHPMLGQPSATATMMRAGVQPNVVPDRCELTFDIRSLPGQSHERVLEIIKDEIKALTDRDSSYRFELEVLLDLPALEIRPDSPAAETTLSVLQEHFERPAQAQGAQYFTDGSVFQRVGGDILIMGPGLPSLAHQVDEHVYVDDYLSAIDVYHHVLLKLLSRN